jgi:hypothetical protein
MVQRCQTRAHAGLALDLPLARYLTVCNHQDQKAAKWRAIARRLRHVFDRLGRSRLSDVSGTW